MCDSMEKPLRIILHDTYQIKGFFSPNRMTIELSSNFEPKLKQYIIDHELEHFNIWKKHGFKGLPRHIWHDYKTTFHVYSNEELNNQFKTFRRANRYKSRMKRLKSIGFVFLYTLAMIGNDVAFIASLTYGYLKNRKKRKKKIKFRLPNWFKSFLE